MEKFCARLACCVSEEKNGLVARRLHGRVVRPVGRLDIYICVRVEARIIYIDSPSMGSRYIDVPEYNHHVSTCMLVSTGSVAHGRPKKKKKNTRTLLLLLSYISGA